MMFVIESAVVGLLRANIRLIVGLHIGLGPTLSEVNQNGIDTIILLIRLAKVGYVMRGYVDNNRTTRTVTILNV